MNVSFGYCEDVLKTLPIGYYLGHPVTLKLEPTGDKTYIELGCERITIGFVNVYNACKNAPDDYDRESIIRSLLYHEVSHAILTPFKLFEYVLSDEWPHNYDQLCRSTIISRCGKQTNKVNNPNYIPKDKLDWIVKNLHDIINIFEDERIESLLNTYYMNTNFKRLVIMLNGNPEKFCNRDAMGRFFAIVRYRHGDPKLVSQVQHIINRHAGLDNASCFQPCLNYVLDIMNLMCAVMQSIDNEKPEQSAQNTNENQSDEASSDNESSSSEQSAQEESEQNQSEELTDDQIDQILKTVEPFLQSFATEEELMATKKMLNGLTTNPDAAAIKTKVNKILNAILNKQKNLSSGSHAYAGRIDPRATLNRDYKWFAKKNQGSAAKHFNKVRFNLFVDSSGSFLDSQNAINALICALKQIESTNPDFSVRVAHCGAGTVLAPVDNPYVTCENFSQLGRNTKEIYDSMQQAQASNVNIVVFDGHMSGSFNKGNAYSAFDHQNCIIVSDDANEDDIRAYAPSAKAIIMNSGYAEAFIDVVLKQIESMLG